MKRTLIILGAVALAGTALAGVASAQQAPDGPVPGQMQLADRGDGPGQHRFMRRGGGHDEQMARRGREHGREMQRGPGMRGPGMGGPGMGEQMMETFDSDHDGRITQAEIDAVRGERLAKFDANGDGTLSLDEYQTLWLDGMRNRMVDQFQFYDDDGNGQVTAEEFNKRFANMVSRMDRNKDGALTDDDHGRRGPQGQRPMMRRGAPPPPPPGGPQQQ